jgi:peptidoglycan/LPS O-acetylase OafA/YrhL
MDYRREIDGLRAVALLTVIMFHADFGVVSGGFVGVDVFFVISGYLITFRLLEEIEHNHFSLKNFYLRRILRILPALLLVLSVTYFVSWLVYPPAAHKTVGQYVFASIFAASNILSLLKGREYFGLEEVSNPLFVTWSLGVEEQFYILFPIFCLLIARLGKGFIFYFFAGAFFASLALSEWGWRENPVANFYFAPARAWELLAGSIAAFIAKKDGIRKSDVLSILGISAILFPVFTFDNKTPFPSLYTLMPVIGTMLVILYGDTRTLIGKFLAYKVFVGIGLISYSAYLWHMPLKIYLNYFFEEYKFINYIYFFLLPAFSFLSYRFVELPFRKKFNIKTALSVIFLVSFILSFLGVLGHFNGGHPMRSELFKNLRINNGFDVACNGNTIIIDSCSNSDSPELAVLGNSYAMTWVNSIVQTKETRLVQLTQDSCAIGFVDNLNEVIPVPCNVFYRRSVETIVNSSSIKTVLISSPFNKEFSSKLFEESFLELLDQLSDKRIIIIGPTPDSPFNVGECILKKSLMNTESSCDFQIFESHRKKIEKLYVFLSERPNIIFIDITNIICPLDICSMYSNKREPMYIDASHLSVRGANIIFNKLDLNLLNN